jgi:methionyl-tRNA synthetase
MADAWTSPVKEFRAFASRVLSSRVIRTRRVPMPSQFSSDDADIIALLDEQLVPSVIDAFERDCDMAPIVDEIAMALRAVVRYLEAMEPWRLEESTWHTAERIDTVLYVSLEALRIVALLLQPCFPYMTSRALDALGIAAPHRTVATASFAFLRPRQPLLLLN